MKKLAEVLECSKDGTAKVALFKHQKCSGCGACNRNIHPGSVIEAENPVNAGVHDFVSIELHRHFSFKAFLILYLLPPLLFFGGLGLGMVLFPEDKGGGIAVAAAFLLLGAALAAAFVFHKSYRPSYKARIIKRA